MNYRLKQTGRNILLLFWLIGVLTGCSTKKNTGASRAYHNLAAHYNVYFNARESMKAGLLRIDQGIPEDYTHILPISKSTLPEAGKVATSDMDLVITKCNKLIKLHSITKSPQRRPNNSDHYKKFASKGEYNNWVDDSYLLMGMASYYKQDYHRAIENFNFVIRKFSDRPTRYDAFLGMASSYIETGDFPRAQEIFNSLTRDGGFPKRLNHVLNLAQAQYYLKKNEPDLAIPFLRTALESRLPHPMKMRINYILAQLLALSNQNEEASKQYLHVLKMHPNYQMAFNARISRMEIMGGNNKEIKNQLEKMLRDQINLEYRDRIYYAKASIALKENKKQDAIADLKNSVRYSAADPKQRALSSLDLGRILFEEKEYIQAACYYDTAVAVIDVNYPGYPEIMIRASGLKRLARELNTIQREDSLQKLALMPANDRNAYINKIIADLKEKEARILAAENAEKASQNYFRSQQSRQQFSVTSGDQNLWYFYNPVTVGIGKSDFQRIWGKRSLEDNWRRKNKQTIMEAETEQVEDSVAKDVIPDNKKKATDPKTVDYYLQDIPLTDSLMQVSREKVKSALFSAGRIYRTDFSDFQRSIDVLLELNLRFKGSIYELPAIFELYQLYRENGNLASAEEYKQRIISEYPDSKYAKFLLNPNYFTELEERNSVIEKKYGETLRSFLAYNFAKAGEEATATLALNPDSTILSKIKFIEVAAQGAGQDHTLFSNALDKYIRTFPKKPTTAIAMRIKELIATNALSDYQKLLASGYIKEEIANEELKNGNDHSNDEFGGKYSYDGNLFHYYVIAFSKEAKVDVNRLIFDIANYNLDYYTDTDFDIEAVSLDSKTQMVLVRSFPDKEEGLIYFRSIIRKRPVFQALKGLEYVNFIASSTNYRTIIAEKDYLSYVPFFVKNYNAYISSNIPADLLPNPQELLAKARKEEEQPVSKGKFVLVQPVIGRDSVKQVKPGALVYNGPYSQKNSSSYCYSLIYLKKQTDETKLGKSFELFNQTNYGSPGIKVSIESLDEKRGILIVSGLGEKDSALAYLQRSGADQSLANSLKGINFRSIIISDENLRIFRNEKNVLQYMEFFNQSK